MNKATLDRVNNSTYLPYSDDYYPLYALGIFLSTDVAGTCGFECFHNWIKDNSRTGISGNVTGLDKIDNNVKLFIFFDYDLYEDDPKQYSLTISIPELTHVLEDWYELIKLKPPYIIITEENGKYSLEGANEPHKSV